MSNKTAWVIDATLSTPPGLFCFCPIEGDINGEYTIVTGMNYIGNRAPAKLVAIVHEDGQEAVNRWCKEHEKELEAMEEPDES